MASSIELHTTYGRTTMPRPDILGGLLSSAHQVDMAPGLDFGQSPPQNPYEQEGGAMRNTNPNELPILVGRVYVYNQPSKALDNRYIVQDFPQEAAPAADVLTPEENPHKAFEMAIESILANPLYVDALNYGEDPEAAKEQVINGLTNLYNHHPESFWHTLGVVENASAIAEILGLSREKAALLRRAAFRHDEGKTSVPEYVLNMPKGKKFTPVELDVLKDHSIQSYSIMVAQGDDATARVAVGHHQMQGDRSYPADPPLDETYEHHDLQMYLAIADVQDGLGKERAYKIAWSEEQVREELHKVFGDRLLKLYGGDIEEAIAFRDAVIEAAINAQKPVEVAEEPPLLERVISA